MNFLLQSCLKCSSADFQFKARPSISRNCQWCRLCCNFGSHWPWGLLSLLVLLRHTKPWFFFLIWSKQGCSHYVFIFTLQYFHNWTGNRWAYIPLRFFLLLKRHDITLFFFFLLCIGCVFEWSRHFKFNVSKLLGIYLNGLGIYRGLIRYLQSRSLWADCEHGRLSNREPWALQHSSLFESYGARQHTWSSFGIYICSWRWLYLLVLSCYFSYNFVLALEFMLAK